MRQLYIKQKVLKAGGQFSVTDADGNEVYFVEGSFMRIPKTFSILDVGRDEVAQIIKKPFSFLPTFLATVYGQKSLTIKKQFSFLKARYTIDAAGIEVQGSLSNMNFEVYQNRNLIGTVRKKWFTWGSQYELDITDGKKEALLVALIIAIDCVKSTQAAAGAGG